MSRPCTDAPKEPRAMKERIHGIFEAHRTSPSWSTPPSRSGAPPAPGGPRREGAAAVEVDAKEDGLDEERQSFHCEPQAKHAAEATHQTWPQQAHLEAQDGSRDRSDREQNRRHLGPPPGQPQRIRVVAN